MNPEAENNESDLSGNETVVLSQPETLVGNSGEPTPSPETSEGDANRSGAKDEVAEEAEKTPEEQIAALQAEVSEWKDRALRRQAEAENVKKMAFKEKMEVRKYAMRGFVEDMLRVADTFKLALGSNAEDKETLSESHKNLLSGIDMTFKELIQVFERHGVVEVEASPGVAFNPNVHEAIGRVPSEQPADTIVDIARGGWKMGDYVLRAAMVSVSMGSAGEEAIKSAGNDEGYMEDAGNNVSNENQKQL